MNEIQQNQLILSKTKLPNILHPNDPRPFFLKIQKLSEENVQAKIKPLTTLEKEQLRKRQKIAKKLARRKNALEQKIQLRKSFIQREIEYGRTSMKKMDLNWRKVLTKLSLPRIKKDLFYTWHQFEKLIDIKDFLISLLMDEMYCIEEAYMLSIQNHFDQVDTIITHFKNFIKDINSSYVLEHKHLEEQYSLLLNSAINTATENQIKLKSICFGLERKRNEQEQTFQKKRYLHKNLEHDLYRCNLNDVEVNSFNQCFTLYKNMLKVIKQVKDKRKKRLEEYVLIRETDKTNQSMISNETKEIIRYRKILKKNWDFFIRRKEESLQSLSFLYNERKFFASSHIVFKNRLHSERKHDQSKKVLIAVHAQNAYDFFQDRLKIGKNLITLMQTCRRYETEEEKVIPYRISDDLFLHNKKSNALSLFWLKVAHVDSVRKALCKEKTNLTYKNWLMRKNLQKMCNCIVCFSFSGKSCNQKCVIENSCMKQICSKRERILR